MRKRTIILSVILGVFVVGVSGGAAYELPKLKRWALGEIETLSKRESPVKVVASDIEFNLFPPGVTLQHVKVEQQDNSIGVVFKPFEIESVDIEPSLFNAVQGRFRLQRVGVHGVNLDLRIPASKNKHKGKPLDGLFLTLSRIPLRKLDLDHANVTFELDQPHTQGDLRGLSLAIDNRLFRVAIDVSASGFKLHDQDTDAHVSADFSTKIALEPSRITLIAVKARSGDSYVVASGSLKGDVEALKFESYDVEGRSSLAIEPLRNFLIASAPQDIHLPVMRGSATVNAVFKKTKAKPGLLNVNAQTHGLVVEKFLVDQVALKAQLDDKTLKFSELKVTNPGGVIDLKDTQLVIADDTTSIKSVVKFEKGQLHEILTSVGVKPTTGPLPLWMEVAGELPCSGTLKPILALDCAGASVHARKILIDSDSKPQKTIAEIPALDGQGSVHVDKQGVSFQATLSAPNSKGTASGTIDFDKGFDIKFESAPLAMKDVTNFANLKLEGAVAMKGSTQGDSHSAVFQMAVDATDVWLGDFWLGNPKANLSYLKGIMTFTNLEGFYTSSRYEGQVSVNLPDNTLKVKAVVPFFESKDLLKIFSRKVVLPFDVTGTGQMRLDVSGPLEFTQLTYDMHASLFRGSIARELFDSAYFDVHTLEGEATSDRIQLNRGASSLTMTGVGHPNGLIDTKVHGQSLRLEDSANLADLGMSLSGALNFDMTMKGPVFSPDTQMDATITRMAIADQSVADSKFHLTLGKKEIDGNGEFMGGAVKSTFKFPLSPDRPFLVDAETTHWNFAPLFAALTANASHKEYDTALTSSLHLAGDSGGLWQASGSWKASELSLKRGALSLAAPKPVEMTLLNGKLRFPHFYLEGDNTYLRVADSANPSERIDSQVTGKIDLGVVSLLFPIFEDLRGMLSLAFSVKGQPGALNLIGSAYIDKGYLKIFDFPHPFEDFKADVLFNEKKLLLNSIRGGFAGGLFSGEGLLEIKGPKNIPINFNAHLEHVDIKIPDGIQTQGSGDLNFSGSSFPYLMKGTYNIAGGSVTKEFTSGSDSPSGIRRSDFLPSFLLQESVSPITMDLNVNFDNGLPVKNSMMDGRVTGQINVGGTPGRPTILGHINAVKNTKVFFNETEFEVLTADLQFTDPTQVNPNLYISASTRVQDYDVTLIVQGTAKNPKLTLSSQPPLSQPDIVSLLALGATSQNRLASSAQGSTASFSVGSAILKQNPIGRELKDRFGVNVQFTSSVDETSTYALQKISLSGQITPKFGWDFNRGVGAYSANDAHLRYSLSNRFSLVGSYEGQTFAEQATADQVRVENTPVFGFDLEYRFEFK